MGSESTIWKKRNKKTFFMRLFPMVLHFFVVVCFVVVWIHFVQLLLLGFPSYPGDGESN